MNTSQATIKNLIKYLIAVANNDKIGGLKQSFFLSNKQLHKILNEYFIFFKNKKELLSDVSYNYSLIKGLSFSPDKNNYVYVKDLSIQNTVYYSKEQHNSYSHRIHSHIIRVFEGKLNGFNDPRSDQNPYPYIFSSTDSYLKFIEYTSNHIIDYYLDYSYLKKRMEHERLIHYIRDNEFMRILYEEMELISEKQFDKYCIKEKLCSLNKSSSTNRENNFNNIFD